jgi:hypothetical protein
MDIMSVVPGFIAKQGRSEVRKSGEKKKKQID